MVMVVRVVLNEEKLNFSGGESAVQISHISAALLASLVVTHVVSSLLLHLCLFDPSYVFSPRQALEAQVLTLLLW